MSGQQIKVGTHNTAPGFPPVSDPQVTLTMSRERAELLFHDLNRVLAILDDAGKELQGDLLEEPGDRGAYDRTDEVLCLLQRELQIEPDPEGLIAQRGRAGT